MARFVILRHDSPRGLHWDFMLERAGVLCTWALCAEPGTANVIAADELADHRLPYLDYQGPVSGDRGTVARWDQGEYETLAWGEGVVRVTLRGEKLRGTAELSKDSGPAECQRWSMRFISASSVSIDAASST
jgi:hypothetical protein